MTGKNVLYATIPFLKRIQPSNCILVVDISFKRMIPPKHLHFLKLFLSTHCTQTLNMTLTRFTIAFEIMMESEVLYWVLFLVNL